MAKIDRFMIAPISTGLQTDLKPWLIADDAFEQLNNAYVFRGRVRKRFGSYLMNQSAPVGVAQLYSRLRINIGNTPGPLNIPDATGSMTQLQEGQMFSVGTDMFTVTYDSLTDEFVILSTNPSASATVDVSGAPNTITFSGETADTAVYYYPANPVMGLITYEDGEINHEPVFAFDTQYAYQYLDNAWIRIGTMQWTGDNSHFFWGYTYRGISNSNYYLFVTNFNAPDKQTYWDGTNWNSFSPILNGTFRLLTSRMILPFKDRLICLNVVENNEGASIGTTDMTTGNFSGSVGAITSLTGQTFLVGTTVYTISTDSAGVQPMTVTAISTKNLPTATFDVDNGNIVITGNNNNANQPVYYLPGSGGTSVAYVNRCRFSQNGSPVSPNGWVDTFGGKGGYIDAPTKEQIVTSEFLKDRLIVYFERSCWELVYTGNEILPFRWQQINTELGAEATFSTVPFDKVVLGIGNIGVHACNGANVERIDNKIPDEVFRISNDNEGVFRVYGIRDYGPEMVYWTFPSNTNTGNFPNRILVFNYKNGAWALNNDTITAFGYYQGQSDVTWGGMEQAWEDLPQTWDSGTLSSSYRQVLAGNQQGFMFIVNYEETRNAPALQITNISVVTGQVTIVCINHNLRGSEDYVAIENLQGCTITSLTGSFIFEIYAVVDEDTLVVEAMTFTGTYSGGGTLARVSRIDIYTKQYNFYVDQDRNAYVSKVDFSVDRTTDGQVTVDMMVSSSEESLLKMGGAGGTQSLVGNGILETSPYLLSSYEKTQDRLWHPIYPQAEGECIQLRIYLSYAQLTNPLIAWSNFELNAMTFFATPTSSRLQ